MGAGQAEIHAQFGGADHEGIGHVVADIAQEAERDRFERLVDVLLHGEQVGQHLRRVGLVGQTVPDGDAGVARQLFGLGLRVDRDIQCRQHAAQYAGGVLINSL